MTNRVAFLINALSIGGAERVFVDDINALWKEGWDVRIVLLFKEGSLRKELTLPPDRVHVLGATSPFDVQAIRTLMMLIREHDTQVLYTTLNEANLVGRLTKLMRPGLRLVTREANHAMAKGLLHKLADILLGSASDRIQCVSHAVVESVAAYAPWLRSRMVVIYNGVNLPVVTSTNRSGNRLLTVGSLTEKKDQRILLDALNLLPNEITLTIVGDGPLRASLEIHARSLGLQDRIRFEGAVPREYLGQFYISHDIFVLPSKYEGCPNVVSEAQAYALPVIAFAIPGINEFITDETGRIVRKRSAGELAAAVRSLVASKKAMLTAGMNGREMVQRDRSASTHISELIVLLSKQI